MDAALTAPATEDSASSLDTKDSAFRLAHYSAIALAGAGGGATWATATVLADGFYSARMVLSAGFVVSGLAQLRKAVGHLTRSVRRVRAVRLATLLGVLQTLVLLLYHPLEAWRWSAHLAPGHMPLMRPAAASQAIGLLWLLCIGSEAALMRHARRPAVATAVVLRPSGSSTRVQHVAGAPPAERGHRAKLMLDAALAMNWMAPNRLVGLSLLQVGLLGMVSSALGLWGRGAAILEPWR